MRTIRLTSLALISLLLLAPAATSLAAEDPAPLPESTQEEGEESEEVEGIPTGYEAAVPIEEAAPADAEQPWTTKFLVPTGLLIAAIAIFATVVLYFVRVVRTRYKVVE